MKKDRNIMKVIVEQFDIIMEGDGVVLARTGGQESSVIVPLWGFNKEGKLLPPRLEEESDFVIPKKEWIDREIGNAVEYFIRDLTTDQYGINGRGDFTNLGPPRYKDGEEIPEIYVALVTNHSSTKKIGLVLDVKPIRIENYSVKVENKENYHYENR